MNCLSFVLSEQLSSYCSGFPDDKVNIDGCINLEESDFFNRRGWAMDVDNSLVDSHLESIPSVGSFTTWRFTGGNSEDLGGDSDWPLNFVIEFPSSFHNLVASGLQWLGFSALEGDSDSLDFFDGLLALSLFFVSVHI